MSRSPLPVRVAAPVALVLWATSALAASSDTYGTGPRPTALVGAMTAGADDVTSTYYNPAGLGLAAASGKVSVLAGYLAGVPQLSINRKLNDAAHLEKHPTQTPEWQGFGQIQAVMPLGGLLSKRAAIGFMLTHPQDKLVRVQLLDPKLPQWTRYQSSTDRFEIAFGFGVRVFDQVSLGVGAVVLSGLEGRVDFDVDLLARKVEQRTLDFKLKTVAAPTAGFTITPMERLRVSFAYRGSLQLGIVQPNVIRLGDIGTLKLDVSGTVHYTPHELSVGISFSPTPSLRLLADAKLSLWSLAPLPAAAIGTSLEGDVPTSLGLDAALSFQTKDPQAGYQNTLTPALAAEYTLPDGVTVLRGGYAWRPTYVPDQVRSSSNLLDADAHIVGLGATLQFHVPFGLFEQPMKFDFAGQAQLQRPRTVVKEQGTSDPVGDYTFGGVVYAASGAIRYDF